ncbi:MAG: isochorismate synthase [Eggerthellaceae bacterium]|nr:isochorismate synthase [Eggerthellaceae bacterium]
MAKVYTYTQPLEADPLGAFCALCGGFTDQFVYYSKERPFRYLGLGRCIALDSLAGMEVEMQGPSALPPTLFSFKRFDEGNPSPSDELFETFPNLRFLLPEVVVVENEQGVFLQVNSLGPVYHARADRFGKRARAAAAPDPQAIPYRVEPDEWTEWNERALAALDAIGAGRVSKVVPCRRLKLEAQRPFSSQDLLANLVAGPARGTVFLYGYGGVFFCGCTPELLVRKRGDQVESMCLAGTCGVGEDESQRDALAAQLLSDEKNLREHAFVVDFIRQVVERNCHQVHIPRTPSILSLADVQHLQTSVSARAMEGCSIQNLAGQLHPTPALSGTPVGEALMLLRQIEPFARGFFGGSVGVVNTEGDGEFSVAIRSGVFDGETGWLYAGCGIVEGSDPRSEYDEIDMKLKTIRSAFDGTPGTTERLAHA